MPFRSQVKERGYQADMAILLQNPRPKPTSLDWFLLSPSSSIPDFHDNSRQRPTGGVLQKNHMATSDPDLGAISDEYGEL